MADETIIRRNEQRKAISGQLYNLSAALFAAVAVKLYADLEMSRAVAIWFLGASLLILVGHNVLGLLEDEGR